MTTSTLAEDFRYTPGWGSLATVTVALIAVGVGAWFNYRAIKKSDERHRIDRHDDFNTQVRAAVVTLLGAAGGLWEAVQDQALGRGVLADELEKKQSTKHMQPPEHRLRESEADRLRPAQMRLDTAARSVRLLAPESPIQQPVKTLTECQGETRQAIQDVDFRDADALRESSTKLHVILSRIGDAIITLEAQTEEDHAFRTTWTPKDKERWQARKLAELQKESTTGQSRSRR